MTEQPPNMSNNTWNPASKEFWGADSDKKINLLFIIAIISILLSIFWFFWLRAIYYNEQGREFIDTWPMLHSFILLMAIKKETRPGPVFKAILFILLIWSTLKFLISCSVSMLILEGYYGDCILCDNFVFYMLGFGFILLQAVMTFLIWMQARKKERYGPRAELFLIVVFSLLIIRVPYSLWYIDNIILDSSYSLSGAIFVLLIHSAPIIFWGVFALLYVYRTEIEPWKETIDPLNHGVPKEKYSGTIDTYTAGKLLEAKELLDKGIISMEEFLEIKKEAIGSNEIVDELVPTIHDIKTEDKRANKDIERGSSKMKEQKELTEMKEKGLISDDEYEKMKKEIIG